MSKKRYNKNFRSKMPIWNFIRRQDGQNINDDTNYRTNDNNSSEPMYIPSPKALIYSSELEYIARCIQDYPDIETGGQLFGSWTASGAPRIIYTIGPGRRANHQHAFFNQDLSYLETIGAKLKEYGLQHIGEWHSHHKLDLSFPSGHDANTMQNSINQLNLKRMLLCIGSINQRGIVINPFNFSIDAHYIEAQWEIVNSYNRLRETIDRDLKNILCHPESTTYTFAKQHIQPQSSVIPNHTGWFSDLNNRLEFKKIIDTLQDLPWIKEVQPKINKNGQITLTVKTRTFVEIISFPFDFPTSPFTIERLGLIEPITTSFQFKEKWESSQDIYKCFRKNYINHLKEHN